MTTEEFIEKSKVIHGNTYDYSSVVFSGSEKKVIIDCKIHGKFGQLPQSHLKGYGCQKCGLIQTQNKSRISKEEFERRAKIVHTDFRYDYSFSEYIDSKTKLLILCKFHGFFLKTPNSHLMGGGCPVCAKENMGKSLRLSKQEFEAKAELLHQNKYSYHEVEYINNHTLVKLFCKKHNSFFLQKPISHLVGSGCPKCAHEKRVKSVTDVSSFWREDQWKTASKSSDKFESFKFYIINCFNENKENFFKIGRTFQKIHCRFDSKKSMPYKYKIVKIIESEDPDYICNLENEFKKLHENYRYEPQINFRGSKECFSYIDLNLLNNNIK